MPPLTLPKLIAAAKTATQEERWIDARRAAASALMIDNGNKEANELMQTAKFSGAVVIYQ